MGVEPRTDEVAPKHLLANSLIFFDVLYGSGNKATPLPELRWINVGKCLNLTRIQKTQVQDINSLNHAEQFVSTPVDTGLLPIYMYLATTAVIYIPIYCYNCERCYNFVICVACDSGPHSTGIWGHSLANYTTLQWLSGP